MFMCTLCAWAQTSGTHMTEVSGVVTDFQTREPLIGVTICDKNDPSKGTVTDFDGHYTIMVDTRKPAMLTFSYVGYDTETRSVTSVTKVLNVPLLTHNEVLDDVVVTAGRFEQRSTDVTVSMEVLKPQALRSQAPTDLSDGLVGYLADAAGCGDHRQAAFYPRRRRMDV